MKIFSLIILVSLVSCAGMQKKDIGAKEFQTGVKHLYGKDGALKDPKKAFSYFEKSAAKGNPLAMDWIGGFYNAGLAGVEKNCKKAIEWFDKSAKLGYSMAVNNLAYTLVTCDDRDHRNPYRAKDYMARLFQQEKAVLTFIDTMAAVYGELGKFEKAVLYQKVVIDLAKLMKLDDVRMSNLTKALKAYKNKKTLDDGYSSDE